MRRDYWDYYLTIEDDLLAVSRYVEFVPENYRCYSLEFARLLLVACSELDMSLKLLCQTIAPGTEAENIREYRPIIVGRFPAFTTIKRYVRKFRLVLDPFTTWTATAAPDWWTYGYNKIKHQRNVFFHHANLKNALDAVAALQIVLFHVYSLRESSDFGDFAASDLPRLIVTYEPSDPDNQEMLVDSIPLLR